jgi:hypothetical protein
MLAFVFRFSDGTLSLSVSAATAWASARPARRLPEQLSCPCPGHRREEQPEPEPS